MQDGADPEFDGTERDLFGRHVEFFRAKRIQDGADLEFDGTERDLLARHVELFRSHLEFFRIERCIFRRHPGF